MEVYCNNKFIFVESVGNEDSKKICKLYVNIVIILGVDSMNSLNFCDY